MRTTLDLDDDLLATARPLARQQGVTLGQFISNLARLSLASAAPMKVRNGILLLTPKASAPRADMEMLNRLRDEE
ncbi:MAG TPA: hypothetical protein VGF49_03495 [Candidatus Solibacter sp.]|jgi:hypothetical protein